MTADPLTNWSLTPIAYVENQRRAIEDDHWGGTLSQIVLVDSLPDDCLAGIKAFSHLEIIFLFHQVPLEKIVTGARHPRNNPDWPSVGIFAQRGKNRPNRLGLAAVRLVRRAGRVLLVQDLDAIHGTPVLDIKPVMQEFLPQGAIRQPAWSTELMQHYWDEGA